MAITEATAGPSWYYQISTKSNEEQQTTYHCYPTCQRDHVDSSIYHVLVCSNATTVVIFRQRLRGEVVSSTPRKSRSQCTTTLCTLYDRLQ